MGNSKEESHNIYDLEPVTYCKQCLSLKIKMLDDNIDYCDECSCTDTAQTDIFTWEEMWKAKYGKPYNNK